MRNVFSILCAAVVVLLGACGNNAGYPQSKLDAEELGYAKQFAAWSVSDKCRLVIENAYDQDKFRGLNDGARLQATQTAMGSLLTSLVQIAQESLPRLHRALPPDAFAAVHDRRLQFLQFVLDSNAREAGLRADDVVSSCRSYHDVSQALFQTVSARTHDHQSNGTLKLTYQPPGIPLALHHDGSFTVKPGIHTPLGSVSLGYTNQVGAKLLIIRSGGKERYFSLQRAFEVYVPANHGISVSGDGSSTVILDVLG